MLLNYQTLYLLIDSFLPEVKDGKHTGHFVANMPDTPENRLKLFDAALKGMISMSDIKTSYRITLKVQSDRYFTLTEAQGNIR